MGFLSGILRVFFKRVFASSSFLQTGFCKWIFVVVLDRSFVFCRYLILGGGFRGYCSLGICEVINLKMVDLVGFEPTTNRL